MGRQTCIVGVAHSANKKHNAFNEMHCTSMMETTHFQVPSVQSSEAKPAAQHVLKVEPFRIPQQQQQQQQQTCYSSTWAYPQHFLPPIKGYNRSYEHPLSIDNPHDSLSTLIDIVYPPHQCSLCDHVSTTSTEARNHHRERHSSIPQFSCLHPHCDLVFKTRAALFYHVQQSHLVICTTNTDNIYTQQDCISPISTPVDTLSSSSPSPKPDTPSSRKSDAYSPSWRVSSFPRISTNRAPRGSKKITLSPHIDSRLNAIYPPLQCPSCHQKFNRKTNVIKHLTDEHYGEEPYRCVIPGCTHPKYYATREGLVYHTLRAHDSNSSTKTTFTASSTTT